MHMAPQEKDKDGNVIPRETKKMDAPNPCQKSHFSGSGSPAVDQDHKACDEHVQGE